MATAAKLQAIVVDDQLTMRALVRSGLQQIGIVNVRDFGSPQEALVGMQAQPVNIVISDFNMPDMDGLEFLRRIRANGAWSNTAFLLLTGRADRDLVQRALQFGANNYLVKPFTVQILKQKIEQVVGALT